MGYEKQTWANGDVITANKLNHMEDGIAGGELETIKVATWDGGGELILERWYYSMGGSGFLEGGTGQNPVSLYDLIGDKKIIDFIFVGYTSENERVDQIFGAVLMGGDGVGRGDPRFYTIEERRSLTGGTMSGIATRQCTKVEVYAVCE